MRRFLLVVWAFAPAFWPTGVGAQSTGSEGAAPPFHAVLLGTGIPIPNPDRACAATLVVAGETTVLVDTGRGALTRLVSAGYNDVSMILYTHFHSDHISELGEIMVNRTIAGADKPMTVLGPKGADEVVKGLLAGFARDNEYRKAHHGEHWHEAGMRADVTEFEPGVIYDNGGLKITMFDVDHEPIEPAVGYRFDFAGKSIVISGDTVATPRMTEAARGCDVLIHEAIDVETIRRGQAMVQRTDPRRAALIEDLLDYHTPTLDLARIAQEAGVKKLVITHLIPSIAPSDAPEKNFIRGMSEIYSGPIVVGRDLMKIVP